MSLNELVKAIYDKAKKEDVDLGVAAAMYRAENKGVDTKEAEDYIHDHYNDLCEAYNSDDKSLWDECFPKEDEVEAPAETEAE